MRGFDAMERHEQHEAHLDVPVPTLVFTIGAIIWSFVTLTYLMSAVMDALRS